MAEIEAIRRVGARLINANSDEVALLGPTSLGLNLVANGLDWKEGDEVVCYPDDYPANVYPWQALAARRACASVPLQPERVGEITPELVLKALTPQTRLVALASCHFLSGFRLDYEGIARGTQPARRPLLPRRHPVARRHHHRRAPHRFPRRRFAQVDARAARRGHLLREAQDISRRSSRRWSARGMSARPASSPSRRSPSSRRRAATNRAR